MRGMRVWQMMIMKKDRKFHEVACRKCGKGGNWKVFTDGKGNFKAEHSCGHISDFDVVKKPDFWKEVMP